MHKIARMTPEVADRLAIRELVESWALYRDALDWDRFRTVWHPPGRMNATWTQGTVEEFIAASRDGFERGVRILHFLGGHTTDVAGDRAVSQVKMTISQRASVEGVECDVVCTGRFYDFFERRDGRWGLVERQPIYEQDRIDPSSRAPRRSSTASSSSASPSATGTSPISRRASGTRSRRTCPA